MTRFLLPVTLAAVLAGPLALAGCASPSGYATPPYPPVPPAQVEAMPKPPVSGEPLVWRPGHWDWTGQGYVWARGEWIPRAGHGTTWQEGWWSLNGTTWSWVPAHWL